MENYRIFVVIQRRRRENRQREIAANRIHLRELRDASDPFQVTDEVFRGLYRLNRELARNLIAELRPLIPVAQRSTAIALEIKVLCTLHFFGQGSYQKSAGTDSNLGLSQASVSRVIEEVTNAMNQNEVLVRWIDFPDSRAARNALINRNFIATRMPGVLGFVDGTHVAITAPIEHEELYVNRKHFHSVNVQIVCDSELKILNILARFPGSSHDSFIWRNSAVKELMEEVWANNERCWLLGDSGYPHEPWLQTPILNAVEGTPEARFTEVHVRARSAVERCIGVLKARFRCLLRHRVLEYTPTKAGRITNACAILHNRCIVARLPLPELPVAVLADDEVPNEDCEAARPHAIPVNRNVLRQARIVRENIIRRLQ